MRIIDKIAMFGPFIGDWKEEIISFRPFIKWIHDNIEFTDYYLSTHFNRKFMYDFISDNNFIPVYESLTRDESKQKNSIHQDIHTKDYSSIILKNIREDISKRTGYLKKNIFQYGPSYIKSPNVISSINKNFEKLPYDKLGNPAKIVFIPDRNGSRGVSESIIEHLYKNYNSDFVVIGDKKCILKDENIIYKRVDYFEMVYKLCVDYISNASLVICPCGHWTIISNQQGVYTLSWGKNIGKYKKDGIYGFDNNNCIINMNKHFQQKVIKKQIDYTIDNLIRSEKW